MHWWQTGVIYQVYPRSFQDTDGDGIGDLPGITSRLDHLAWLGVDALWLSPIFPSPMADFGYDVSDYTDVHPMFGTLADLDRLIEEAHRLGLRVLLDLVANHTSEEHRWFVESRASRANARRDWYIWRDPAPDGGPPTNWISEFGGSAWTLDPATGQYYLHSYLREQPDLNWRNEAVREAILDVMRFWLTRGIDGFRLDAINHLYKDDRFRDNPPNPRWKPEDGPALRQRQIHSKNLPENHGALRLMREVADAFGPDRVLVGEMYLPFDELAAYYGADAPEIHLPANFHLIRGPWTARAIADAIVAYEAAMPASGWPNWVLGNHDRHRVASRVGDAQARVAAMLLLTLRGTPTLYYGDEIGMRDVPIPPSLVQDPWEKNCPGLGLGRDPERTPMRWIAGPGAGFTTGTPWLPLGDDIGEVNVAAQRENPRSMLSLHRALLALRRAHAALSCGSIDVRGVHGSALLFERRHETEVLTVALNFGHARQRIRVERSTILLDTSLARAGEPVGGVTDLGPGEGLVLVPDAQRT